MNFMKEQINNHIMLTIYWLFPGGVVDGDKSHPYYKYGGLWKNRRRK